MNVPRRLAHCGEQRSGILGQVTDRVAESPLTEGKKFMEIADLECNKPEVSEYNKKEEEMKGFGPCLLLKDEWWCLTRINEQKVF